MSSPRDISLDTERPRIGVDVGAFMDSTSLSFVVADPRQPDSPIIYVNRAFELTTGYSARFVLGRNCRFLQGEDTDPDAVKSLAIALSRGEGVRQTILNYRADGSPFVNDLVITPIHDAAGDLAYFVGVQREILPGEADSESLRRRTVDIVRQQVQLHLSVVMQMSRMHLEGGRDGGEAMGAAGGSGTPTDFINLLRRLEILDLLYENLSASSLTDEMLDAGAYVSQIVSKIAAKNPQAGVRVNIRADAAVMPLDSAVRLGVVLAELVDTSLASAFTGMDGGLLEVALVNEKNYVELSVYNDGDSEPSTEPWLDDGDMTLRIIQKLLVDIGATFETIEVDTGREVRVRVPKRRGR